MKVVLTTPGRFHTFALARELHAAGHLSAVVSAFPWSKLKREGLPHDRVKTYPAGTLTRVALGRLGLARGSTGRMLDDRKAETIDRRSERWTRDADIFMSLSGCGLETGRAVQRRGGVHVCDRGSSHILVQKRILEEEAARFGVPATVISARAIRRELAEYAAADAITVPSEFARRSFIAEGTPPGKVHEIPYGSDTARFEPCGAPDDDAFDVLFVGALSLQKGLPYLFRAFETLRHPRKRLTVVGSSTDQGGFVRSLAPPGARFLGHVANPLLARVMSRSHVLVLPSVQDGFGMVMAEALACGCPVIASENTGARDLYADGVEGFVVPIRSARAIAETLQRMADDPPGRRRMSEAARARMLSRRGWGDYGRRMTGLFESLIAGRDAVRP